MSNVKHKKAGLPPGSIVYTGPKRDENVIVDMYVFNVDKLEKHEHISLDKIREYRDSDMISWINLTGVHDLSLVKEVGDIFDIHALTLEDIVNVDLRPKLDELDDHIYAACKMVYFEGEEMRFENINLIFGSNYVISFQEIPGDVFDPIRKRLESANAKIRSNSSDFLFYALIDSIIDHYYIVLETLGDKIEELEDELEHDHDPQILHKIQKRKKNLIRLRKSVYPLREVVSGLEKSESPLFKENTTKYIHDLYDHTIQIIETIETYRDLITSLSDLFMSKVSNRMNNIMQVLTIIATIFIPLTFIAGIYGMNFENMPELSSRYGYHIVWLVMILVAIVMLFYFRRKRWI